MLRKSYQTFTVHKVVFKQRQIRAACAALVIHIVRELLRAVGVLACFDPQWPSLKLRVAGLNLLSVGFERITFVLDDQDYDDSA